jgi:hypothetical protein
MKLSERERAKTSAQGRPKRRSFREPGGLLVGWIKVNKYPSKVKGTTQHFSFLTFFGTIYPFLRPRGLLAPEICDSP